MREARLILLPGLGADARLLGPQKAAFGHAVETPDWLEPEGDESLERYARRWAEALRDESDERPVFVGGVSFGGIVAMHMAEALRPEAVVLIASCRSSDDVPMRFEIAQRLGSFVPDATVGKLLPLLAIPFAVLDGLDSDHLKLLRSMAKDTDPALLQWAGRAVANWQFDLAHELPCPVHRIHGARDWVIPYRGDGEGHPGEPTEVLPHGKHLINLTLDRTVNGWLRGVVQRHNATLPDLPVRPPQRRDTPTYLASAT